MERSAIPVRLSTLLDDPNRLPQKAQEASLLLSQSR